MQAQAVVDGVVRGTALVLGEPFSFRGGVDPATGVIVDRHHPQAGASMAGTVLVLPDPRGSVGGFGTLAECLRLGTGPAAIVLPSGPPSLYLSRFAPIEPERSVRYIFGVGMPGEIGDAERARDHWATDVVGPEDIRLCEAVQRGLRQRGYNQGRHVIDAARNEWSEHSLHRSHRQYLEHMAILEPARRRDVEDRAAQLIAVDMMPRGVGELIHSRLARRAMEGEWGAFLPELS